MNKSVNSHKRSWITTVIAGIIAVISFYAAFSSFEYSFLGFLFTSLLLLFGILATLISVEGKPKTLRELLDSWFFLP